MNPKVDFFFAKPGPWQEAFGLLRDAILECGLVEELKWGCPCYLFGKKNIVLIHGFKDYCAVLFFKGALLKDPQGALIQQTENVQAARQMRFTTAGGVAQLKPVLQAYIFEAVGAEEAGLKVELKPTAEFKMPEEFSGQLSARPDLKAAFEALTPGRQRAYLLHFSSPKQAKTRMARIEKACPQILEGKGLNDD